MDEIVCEGFLTKSPPEKKINRARWHRRWFVLRRLHGNIVLQYFKDRNSGKPKGTINLNEIEQVDQGLTFETRKFPANAFIFDIVTNRRKYFLVASSEEDMIRWVRYICEVCGFHLEGADPNEEELGVPAAQPMTVHDQHDEVEPRYTEEPIKSVPAYQKIEEGYFELSDSVTGEGTDTTDGTRQYSKVSSVSSASGRDSGVATLDEPIDIRQSFESSDSSAPSDSAPPPPPKTPKYADSTDQGDIYDIPPVRYSYTSDSEGIYDCPPSLRRPSYQTDPTEEMESLYKTVPPPRPSTSASIDFPLSPLNGSVFEQQESDIYDVPREPRTGTRQVYDTPPVVLHNSDELSQSTDNLAKTFQNISIRNSLGANSATGDYDLYNIPSLPNSLNNSGNFAGSSLHDRHGPVSPPMDVAPPRPPKPARLQGPATPPPSFDDTYNVPLNLQPQVSAVDLHHRLTQEVKGQTTREQYATPPAWGGGGHTWVDNTVTKARYINAKRTEPQTKVGMPINQRSSLDGIVPAPERGCYVNFRDERYVCMPHNEEQQPSYLSMQGSSMNSTSFDHCEETYMPMEGSVDGMADSYTLMQSPSAGSGVPPPLIPRSMSVSSQSSRNSQGELPPPIPRSLSTSSRNSLGAAPPPVDRNSKPDRRHGSMAHSPDLAAMLGLGSFYATPEDPACEVDLGDIVASARTQSYSKRGAGVAKPESLLQESFRRRTNTEESNTSSSGESGVGQEVHYVTPTDGRHQPTSSDEVYVYKDPPEMTPKLEKAQAVAIQQSQASDPTKEVPVFESIANTNIPCPIAEEGDDIKIEYLELDHTKNEERPPPRPPKPPSSTSVEYFDLDAQKTKALREVTEKRKKESYNKAT